MRSREKEDLKKKMKDHASLTTGVRPKEKSITKNASMIGQVLPKIMQDRNCGNSQSMVREDKWIPRCKVMVDVGNKRRRENSENSGKAREKQDQE